jgi:hypothetical protein
MDEGWRDGLAIARGRALDWRADAVLIELRVACELFEPGFRWQATYFSPDAQAYYSTDTAEVVPVEIDPPISTGAAGGADSIHSAPADPGDEMDIPTTTRPCVSNPFVS